MTAVRVGGGLGFYGDSYRPALDLIEAGRVQYVAFDHLAELTLAILAKDRGRDPSLGYARDLLPLLRDLWHAALRRGVCLISNAGGLNPMAAGAAAAEVARDLGLPARIGVVHGDDLLGRLGLVAWDEPAAGAPMPVFANAYVGAAPIQSALDQGADLVITGRVADSALFLGAIAHALHWDVSGAGTTDWNRLALGAVAGHLLEGSGQVTGGNHSGDWQSIPNLDRIGYPIAEVSDAGLLRITTVPGSGGRVTRDTVREQLLYEVHDPSRYLTPDVTVDLSEASLAEVGPDTVEVRGVRGHPRPEAYKVMAGCPDGFLGQGLIGFSWPDALEKAEAAAAILARQADALGLSPTAPAAEYLGVSSFHGPLAAAPDRGRLNEVYLRMTLRTATRSAADAFARLFPPLALSGPPTASGLLGVDRVRELSRLRTGLIPRPPLDGGIRVDVRPAPAFLAGHSERRGGSNP